MNFSLLGLRAWAFINHNDFDLHRKSISEITKQLQPDKLRLNSLKKPKDLHSQLVQNTLSKLNITYKSTIIDNLTNNKVADNEKAAKLLIDLIQQSRFNLFVNQKQVAVYTRLTTFLDPTFTFVSPALLSVAALTTLFGNRSAVIVEEILIPLINLINFVDGLRILVCETKYGLIAFNLDVIVSNKSVAIERNTLIQLLNEIATDIFQLSDYEKVHSVINDRDESGHSENITAPAVSITTLNAPDLLNRLLDSIRYNIQIFHIEPSVIYVLDDCLDTSIINQNKGVVAKFRAHGLNVVYLGYKDAYPEQFPNRNIVCSKLYDLGIKAKPAGVEGFSPSIGGNGNWALCMAGSTDPIICLDHDIELVCYISEKVILSKETSQIRTIESTFTVESGVYELSDSVDKFLRIPVNVFQWLKKFDLKDRFWISGNENRTKDDVSFERLDLHAQEYLDGVSHLTVCHVGGMQDISAKSLLFSSLENGGTEALLPKLFSPVKPLVPALLERSKIIFTTAIFVKNSHSLSPLPVFDTHIRFNDLAYGLLHRALIRTPVFWAPVYLWHRRKFGLRSEHDYASYLLNEDYMNIILSLMERGIGDQLFESFEELASCIKGSCSSEQIYPEVEYTLMFAIELFLHLESQGDRVVGGSQLRESIVKHYFFNEEPKLNSTIISRHLVFIESEIESVITQLRQRADVNNFFSMGFGNSPI